MRVVLAALALLTASAAAQAATFLPVHLPDGRLGLRLEGPITKDDQVRFANALSLWPAAKTVVLASPGGLILPALAIGVEIHQRQLATMVLSGEECASACADIWLAANHRYLAQDARLGFHGIYGNDGATVAMTGAGNGLVGAYMARLGYSDSAVVFATGAQPNEIAWRDPRNPFNMNGITFETAPTGARSAPK